MVLEHDIFPFLNLVIGISLLYLFYHQVQAERSLRIEDTDEFSNPPKNQTLSGVLSTKVLSSIREDIDDDDEMAKMWLSTHNQFQTFLV